MDLAEACRHFHLDLNAMLDKADELAKQLRAGQRKRGRIAKAVTKVWASARLHEGEGEFGKVLKRLYRLAGLGGVRKLRRRAMRDALADPALAERVCDYIRCTGTVSDSVEFISSLMRHEEQVYPDVNVAAVESLLRLEAEGHDARQLRQLASDLLNDRNMPGGDDCAAIAPLLLLRFWNRRKRPPKAADLPAEHGG